MAQAPKRFAEVLQHAKSGAQIQPHHGSSEEIGSRFWTWAGHHSMQMDTHSPAMGRGPEQTIRRLRMCILQWITPTRKPADTKREAPAHFFEVAQRANDASYRQPTDMVRAAFISCGISVPLPPLAIASSSSGSQDGNNDCDYNHYKLLSGDGPYVMFHRQMFLCIAPASKKITFVELWPPHEPVSGVNFLYPPPLFFLP